ncbi:MAG: hypothetical protein ABIJ09_25030, partial [Pseudomonadota bacterium]
MPIAVLIAAGFAGGTALGPHLPIPSTLALAFAVVLSVALAGMVLWRRGPRVLVLLSLSLCLGLAARRAELSTQERVLLAL